MNYSSFYFTKQYTELVFHQKGKTTNKEFVSAVKIQDFKYRVWCKKNVTTLFFTVFVKKLKLFCSHKYLFDQFG